MKAHTMKVDLCVIGAGTAGMHAFSTAQRAGAKVVLVDPGPLGTTCARVGCMPSKALLHAGKRWSTLRALLPEGAMQHLPPGHTTAQQLWQQALLIRDDLVAGNVRQLHRLADDDLLQASARFVAPDALLLSNGQHVLARAFVVATGSQPVLPAKLKTQLGDALITTDDLFYLPQLPASVAVMGLGAIGLEMGLALHRLGVSVLAAGRSPVLAKMADPQVAQAAHAYFAQELPMVLGQEHMQVQRTPDGVCMQAGGQTIQAQYLLAALGRAPRIEGLQLDQAGVQLDAKGRPILESDLESGPESGQLRCKGSMVFLAGDTAPGAALMHEAGHEGSLAAQQALRALGDAQWSDITPRQRTVPIGIVFSDPDMAQVGLRFDQLPQDALIATVQGKDSGRSKLLQAPHHILRVYAERGTGRLLGASLLCAQGEHLAHALAWAVQRGETVHSMLELPYYHPTLEEMIDTAMRQLRRSLREDAKSA